MGKIRVFNQKTVPKSILVNAKKYTRFLPVGVAFSDYFVFASSYLESQSFSVNQVCKNSSFPKIFTAVANSKNPNRKMRGKYLSKLISTYKLMEMDLEVDKETVLIAPQREGYFLAKELGWHKKVGLASFPHAKRIHYQGGIVVGLTEIALTQNINKAVIVDGAIASGSTLMAIILRLKERNINNINVYAVHGTTKSMQILEKFAKENQVNLRINIAYISGKLNEHFYAVSPQQPKKLIMGDLGDTISDLFEVAVNHD